MTRRILVVGAGLAGLTAAYRLRQQGHEVLVLEAGDKVGGRAKTIEKSGYVFDTGATVLSSVYRSYLSLAQELGIADLIEPASTAMGVIRDGAVHHIDGARILSTGLGTRLLSWKSKFAMAKALIDVLAAKRQGMLDFADIYKAAPLDCETAPEYCRRRLNQELDDYLCDPIVRSMVVIDSATISKVEVFSGLSNIFGVTTYGMRGGVGVFPTRLAERLEVKTHCSAISVKPNGDRVEVRWEEQGRFVTDSVDGCVVACPLPGAAQLCPHNAALQAFAGKLGSYSKIITVAIGTRVAPASAAGVVLVPKKENADICLFLLNHHFNKSAAPVGHGVTVALFEAGVSAELIVAPDEAIIERAMVYFRRVFPEAAASVDMTHVARWPVGMPLSRVGAYRAMAEFNASLDDSSRIQFCGDYLGAIGQENAVEQGNRAADRMRCALI